MHILVDKTNWIILTLVGLVILVILYGLSFSPPPTDFEAWMVEPGWVFFDTGQLTSEIFGNVLETQNGCLGQGNMLHYLFGAATYWFGHNILNVRIISFLCSLLLLILLYRFSLTIGNRLSAAISVLCLTASTAFFYASHLARASIFISTLHLFAFICLWFYRYHVDQKRRVFYAGMAAFASFSTIMFHLSGVAVIASVTVVFLFINQNKKLNLDHLVFLSAGLMISAIWVLIHIGPLGINLFMKKLSLGSGYFLNPSRIIQWLPLNYFFVSKFNFFYLFSFLISVYYFFRIRDCLRFVILYLAVYAFFSLFVNEDPEPHKAMIFLPFVSIVIGQGVARSGQWWRGDYRPAWIQKTAIVFLIVFTVSGVTFGALKDIIYTARGRSVSYDKYLADIKAVIPPDVIVMGQPHLWFGLAGRNRLLGGTYYLSRAHSYMRAFPKLKLDNSQPDLSAGETSQIFDFFKKRGILYIVASEDMVNLMRLNGLFSDSFNNRITKLKSIPTFFYGHENFNPGFVYIYKINNY